VPNAVHLHELECVAPHDILGASLAANAQNDERTAQLLIEAHDVETERDLKKLARQTSSQSAAEDARMSELTVNHHTTQSARSWSPSTHKLWGAAQRKRAAELLMIGYLLAQKYAADESGSLLDVWVSHVIPQVITRRVDDKAAGSKMKSTATSDEKAIWDRELWDVPIRRATCWLTHRHRTHNSYEVFREFL
jgi:hypothetical protein